ncbi:hypothetical protein ALC60_08438, partial [Trachymyrmex zeteki]
STYSENRSIGSRRDSSRGRTRSVSSIGGLSVKDVDMVRKLVLEKERKERKLNIVIKGITEEEAGEMKDAERNKEWSRKGSYEEHIKELRRKGKLAVRKVWGLGERWCRNDFKRRWNLFKYLVQSVMAYGVEIWGWEEKVELEKVMLDYVRECWEEKENNRWRDLYGQDRMGYYNRNGWGIEAREVRGGSKGFEEEPVNRERDLQRQWEEGKIRNARYNVRYKTWETIMETPKMEHLYI